MMVVRGGSVLVLLLPFVVASSSSSTSSSSGRVGGWAPIEEIGDPHVRELGAYAVREHNREANSKLELRRVVKGETQVVAGINYKLVIEASSSSSNGGGGGDDDKGKEKKRYEAIVWEKAWENFRKLTSFKPLN